MAIAYMKQGRFPHFRRWMFFCILLGGWFASVYFMRTILTHDVHNQHSFLYGIGIGIISFFAGTWAYIVVVVVVVVIGLCILEIKEQHDILKTKKKLDM